MSRLPQENIKQKETQNLIKRLKIEIKDDFLLASVIAKLELCDELEEQLKYYKDLEKVRRTW